MNVWSKRINKMHPFNHAFRSVLQNVPKILLKLMHVGNRRISGVLFHAYLTVRLKSYRSPKLTENVNSLDYSQTIKSSASFTKMNHLILLLRLLFNSAIGFKTWLNRLTNRRQYDPKLIAIVLYELTHWRPVCFGFCERTWFFHFFYLTELL